ncbi:hypothetical protein VTK56DRAFT_3703 [Thermocarpiscus australiensis]
MAAQCQDLLGRQIFDLNPVLPDAADDDWEWPDYSTLPPPPPTPPPLPVPVWSIGPEDFEDPDTVKGILDAHSRVVHGRLVRIAQGKFYQLLPDAMVDWGAPGNYNMCRVRDCRCLGQKGPSRTHLRRHLQAKYHLKRASQFEGVDGTDEVSIRHIIRFDPPPAAGNTGIPGEPGKVESNTGTGESDDAEGISKDIKFTWDMPELAQDSDHRAHGEVEENKDVDIGEDEWPWSW